MEESVIDSLGVRERATEILKRAVVHTFDTMIGLTAEVGEVYQAQPSSASGRSVAGFIGWVGNWNGTGIFECTPEFACKLSNLLLGTELTAINEEALDAVAEMTNIVYGGMKAELETELGAMGLSTPTVVYGNDVGMRSTGEPFTVLPVVVDGCEIRFKLYMVRVEEKRNPMSHFWAASHCGAL